MGIRQVDEGVVASHRSASQVASLPGSPSQVASLPGSPSQVLRQQSDGKLPLPPQIRPRLKIRRERHDGLLPLFMALKALLPGTSRW